MFGLDIGTTAPCWGDIHHADGPRLLSRCHVASGRLARTIGLLATSELPPEGGLLIPGCRSVHTVGMRQRIACVWLGDGGRVVRVDGQVAPWRLAGCRHARAVVEVAPGVAVRRGDVLCASSAAIRRALGRDVDEKCANCGERVSRKGGETDPPNPHTRDGRNGPADERRGGGR